MLNDWRDKVCQNLQWPTLENTEIPSKIPPRPSLKLWKYVKVGQSGPKLCKKDHTQIGQSYGEGDIVSTMVIWRWARWTVIVCFHRCNMHDPNQFCIFTEQIKMTAVFKGWDRPKDRSTERVNSAKSKRSWSFQSLNPRNGLNRGKFWRHRSSQGKIDDGQHLC